MGLAAAQAQAQPSILGTVALEQQEELQPSQLITVRSLFRLLEVALAQRRQGQPPLEAEAEPVVTAVGVTARQGLLRALLD